MINYFKNALFYEMFFILINFRLGAVHTSANGGLRNGEQPNKQISGSIAEGYFCQHLIMNIRSYECVQFLIISELNVSSHIIFWPE